MNMHIHVAETLIAAALCHRSDLEAIHKPCKRLLKHLVLLRPEIVFLERGFRPLNSSVYEVLALSYFAKAW